MVKAYRKIIFVNNIELENTRHCLEDEQLRYLDRAGFKRVGEDYVFKTKKITIKFHRIYY